MGRGIAAVVPITVSPHESGWRREIEVDKFPALADFYTLDEETGVYTIKHEILLENYKPFLSEFYDIIGEECETLDAPKAATYEEFRALYDCKARNGKIPFAEREWYLSIVGGECREYWKFYSGSYKALLEVYCTFTHFERILARAMKNPLADAVKFGLYG